MSHKAAIESRAYEYWVYQQLEPNDVLITGNAKRHTPTWVAVAECAKIYCEMDQANPTSKKTWEQKEQDENKWIEKHY